MKKEHEYSAKQVAHAENDTRDRSGASYLFEKMDLAVISLLLISGTDAEVIHPAKMLHPIEGVDTA